MMAWLRGRMDRLRATWQRISDSLDEAGRKEQEYLLSIANDPAALQNYLVQREATNTLLP
jgi:hypothetical protein